MTTLFEVTKLFTNGSLKGFWVKEVTTVRFVEGKHYKGSYGPDYKVVAVNTASKGAKVGVVAGGKPEGA